MNDVIRFFVPGVSTGQPRHQTVRTRGKNGAMHQFPAKRNHPIHNYRAAVRYGFMQAGGQMLSGPLSVRIVWVMPRPANRCWKRRPMPREFKDTKPDLDNLEKGVFDELEKLAFENDSRIASVVKAKVIASGDVPDPIGTYIQIGTVKDHEIGLIDQFIRRFEGAK